MITTFRLVCRTFANTKLTIKWQRQNTKRLQYLVGHNVEKRLNKMVEQKFLKFEERYKKDNEE